MPREFQKVKTPSLRDNLHMKVVRISAARTSCLEF